VPAIRRRITPIILCLFASYLIGNGRMPLWDRDEPWYALISRTMVRTGDWVVPRAAGQTFPGKPPLAYWCQAAAMKVMGTLSGDVFAARFPSAVAVTLALVLLAVVITIAIGRRRAICTVLIFGTSALTMVCAKMCLTDALLTLWITAAQLCLAAIYLGSRRRWVALALWISVGLAVLTKGPVVAGVLGMTAIVLLLLDVAGRWRSAAAWAGAANWWPKVRPLSGLVVVLAVVGPWANAVQRRDPSFLRVTLRDKMLVPIAKKALEGHAGPPGYYLLTVWPSFMPWSLLIPMALWRGWQNRRLPQVRFAVAATIGPWIAFEVVRQKLPHYLLPVLPALSFLTADGVVRCLRGQYRDLETSGFVRAVAAWAIIVALVAAAPWAATNPKWNFGPQPLIAMVVLSAVGVACALAVYVLFRQRRPTLGLSAMSAGMAVAVVTTTTLYLPRAGFLQISPRAAAAMIRHNVPQSGAVTLIGYKEPSLFFYYPGTWEDGGERFLNGQPRLFRQWILVTRDLLEQSPPHIRRMWAPVEIIRGWHYNDGLKLVDVILARRRDSPDDEPQIHADEPR